MDEQHFKKLVASNITHFRKLGNMTQLELAERLNYSDKAVSKWERGESLPDIYVLMKIADIFGVTMNDLVGEEKVKKLPASAEYKKKKHIIITLLAVGLVWLSVSVIFFFLKLMNFTLFSPQMIFVYAVPVSFIVLIVFSRLWWNIAMRACSVSGLIWSAAASVAVSSSNKNLFYAFLIAAILQILAIMWFCLIWLHTKRNK